jgi:hypothetical protein
MTVRSLRIAALVAALPLFAALPGCFVATDVLNPDFVAGIGFDPATIIPAQGRLIIAFRNATQFTVTGAFATVAKDATATVDELVTVSATDIAANETRTMVVDCPLAVVAPGGATVAEAGTAVAVAYGGSALLSGSDFFCGDVIEIAVVQLGGDEEAALFDIQVRVLPGR